MTVDELASDGREQALGRRIVIRGPDATHRGGDPRLLQSPGEPLNPVWLARSECTMVLTGALEPDGIAQRGDDAEAFIRQSIE